METPFEETEFDEEDDGVLADPPNPWPPILDTKYWSKDVLAQPWNAAGTASPFAGAVAFPAISVSNTSGATYTTASTIGNLK